MPEDADDRTWGVYVHVPWCRVRCPYCAFEIEPRTDRPPAEAWADGVRADAARWRDRFLGSPRTLYFGGGTPSRVDPSVLAGLIAHFGATDVTAEANPEDLDAGWLDGAIAAGVTRISLGVQTLDPGFARRLGRAHLDARPVLEGLARAGLASWSVDLMFALPGQTLDDLERDLDGLVACGAPHVSLYGLTVEPGTGYARLARRGRLELPDEDLWRAMYDRIVERLESAGILRYEVSNFARAGHESAHNRLYWTGAPYLGVGPSAHGLAPDGARWVNPPLPRWWTDPSPAVEHPDPRQRAVDRLVSGVRGIEGIAPHELIGYRLEPRTLRQLVSAGLLAPGPRVRLAASGFPVADAVVRALVRALEEDGRPTS